jgi:four helix bundle protein
VRAFRELTVWKKAHALTLGVFRATQRVRRGEFPGLAPQLRRAAASIPTNIAEGCGHFGQREFARFLQMAMASASELEYLLLLATELGMLSANTYAVLETQVKEAKRMLTSLIQRVRSDVAQEADGKRSRPPSNLTADR